jgi:Tubulin like/WD40-like Beta Propeller Repeat
MNRQIAGLLLAAGLLIGGPLRVWAQPPSPTPQAQAAPTPADGGGPQAGLLGPQRPEVPAPRGLLDPLPRPSQPAFCSSQNWWVPALLFPFLLILTFILLLWWWSRRNEVAWYNLWLGWKWPCRILSILGFFYLLFLALLVGREMFAGLCEPTEAVYFWRLDQSGDSGIFLTSQGGDAAPVPFRQLNREGCVGCHAVSNVSHRIAAAQGPVPASGVVLSLTGEEVQISEIEALFVSWSPDGERLAYSDSAGDIRILDLERGVVAPLLGASEPGVTEVMPSWSPDGATIAFVRSFTPASIGGASIDGPTDIWVVPAMGGEARPLRGASGDGFNYYPAYSPDRRWLAFTRHTTGHRTYADDAAEIFLVPAAGGERRRLEANDAGTLRNVSNSWPTWSRDGRWLAFNSKRQDPSFDVFVTRIDEDGKSGPAVALAGASEPGVFEHTPFWGDPLQLLPLWKRILNLWPWLLPLVPLLLLRHLFCRESVPPPRPLPPIGSRPEPRLPVQFLDRWSGVPPEWRPAPTLVIGLGGSGRQVLTQLKKNLLDAGGGEWREEVQLLLLDTAQQEVVQGQVVQVEVAGIRLEAEEQLILGEDLRDLIRRMAQDADSEPELQTWFPTHEYARVHRLTDAEMDARRTTHQRRPIGRAVVFQDLRRGEAGRLWSTLSGAVKKGAHDERARVIIVGSLAGGFGSGVLADVAYLVRRAAETAAGNAAAVITAFLTTDSAFAVHTRSGRLKLNSMATLRELGRFLLARGRPFPMPYKRQGPDPILNGYIEWSLFDEVFVLDGQRPQHPLTLLEPEKGMFPLMADLITAFIDQGSRLVEEVRANLRTQAAATQVETGEPVVSTLGAFTYRLPLRDLARGLQLRFSHDLLVLFLAGPEADDRSVLLFARACRDQYPDGLPAMADHFLRGTLYGERQGVGGASALLADLARGGGPASEWRSVKIDAMADHVIHFRQVLTAVTLRLLNGRAEDEITVARCGKLGYALTFLDELTATLGRARSRASYWLSQAAEPMRPGCAALLALLDQEEPAVDDLRLQLTGAADLLLGGEPAQGPAGTASRRGLLDWLRNELTQERRWREEMRQVPVRRTFAEEEFFDGLYKVHFAPHLAAQGLEHLFWREQSAGGVEISVAHEEWNDRSFPLTQEGGRELQTALLDLAASIGRTVWNLRLDSLFDDEDRGLWQVNRLKRQEAENAHSWAEPVTTVQVGKAREQQPARYLWVNSTVRSQEVFAREVQMVANMRERVHVLSATDPYSATLFTSLDVLPLSALDCTVRLQADYRDAHQLDEVPAARDMRLLPEPLHVFVAERNALAFEMRLAELREAPRLFHPLFVGALENRHRARAFCLGYALGWMRRSRFEERGEWRERYVLVLPDTTGEIPLTRGDHPNHPVALVVRAMQGFVLGHPAEDRVQQEFPDAELVRMLTTAITGTIRGSIHSLKEFLREKPLDIANERRIGTADFWAVARLFVIDEISNQLPASPGASAG